MSVSYGGDSITFADGSVQSGGWTGMRNRIINGAMEIDQRNAGASVAIASGGNPYTLDRFRSDNSTDGAITVQRVTDAPTGFVNSMKYTVTTADASLASTQYLGLNHFIEGFNTADLMWGTANAKTITISFWVKSSITGNYPVSFDNNAADRFYVGQYSINSANTWEYKTVTLAGDTSGTWLTDNGRGFNVRWFLGSGTGWEASANSWQTGAKYTFSGAASVIGTLNATWQITGVQLEVGSVATPFERRPYGMELTLCQRYFRSIKAGQIGFWANTTTARLQLQFIGMRAAPNYSVSAALTITDNASNPAQSSGAIADNGSDANGGQVDCANFSGAIAARVAAMLSSSAGSILISAEL